MHSRNSKDEAASSSKDAIKLKAYFSYTPCDIANHPMKDIINGKSTGNSTKAAPNKPRKFGSVCKATKVLASTYSSFPILVPNIPSSIIKGFNNPFCRNSYAIFGHCPPKNDPLAFYCGNGVDLISNSIS